ncbi:hypothetical protein SPBR_01164 [Sporothrix brasiliensis 5110]|uniref:Uncharacterized protein n=1 Tax=Sporothrix brasiliensis 5110 TaxID=1398154 RepID=A0A0C2IZK6_9PEZI|nr:uncharacterized protein SPBR_01164 [Sporothrix brasiliensis 5110]KIH90407.1 hypothetical protein SPBR_01164 [Sporothrix brasiliensis 5110]
MSKRADIEMKELKASCQLSLTTVVDIGKEAGAGSSAYLDLEADHVESHKRENCASGVSGGDRDWKPQHIGLAGSNW